MLYRLRKDLANYLRSAKLWTGLIIGLAGYFYVFANLLKVSRSSNYEINIFETYVSGSSNSWVMTVTIAGLVFALSDMPYLSPFEMNAIYRSSKQKRITEKFLFTVICTFIFYILQLIITIIMSAAFSYTENIWSFFSTVISEQLRSNFSPASAAIFGLLLNLMYGLMAASILFTLSLILDKGAAYAVIFTFQAVQDFLLARLRNFHYYCLFRNSILEYHGKLGKELILNLTIEFIVICFALIASLMVKDKISYDVRQGENNLL